MPVCAEQGQKLSRRVSPDDDGPAMLVLKRDFLGGGQVNRDWTEWQSQLYAWMARIPSGRVVTYGQLARLIGLPTGARWVGRQMGCLPPDSTLPWHRVINARGRSSLPLDATGSNRQLRLLAQEGVPITDGHIRLRECQWEPLAETG